MVKSRWKPLLAGFALAVGLGIFVLSIVGAPTTVRAQDDAGTTAGERSSAFRAVEGLWGDVALPLPLRLPCAAYAGGDTVRGRAPHAGARERCLRGSGRLDAFR